MEYNKCVNFVRSCSEDKHFMVRGAVKFYYAGENASHVFSLGLDSDGNLWKRSECNDFCNEEGKEEETLEVSYCRIEKDKDANKDIYVGRSGDIFEKMEPLEIVIRVYEDDDPIIEEPKEKRIKPSKSERRAMVQRRRMQAQQEME